ncbi:MAG: iron chelate uptake ABC transporter family permease subunit [Hyphomicrobiaceae bacterium]
MEPFLLRAFAAGFGLALLAAPLGCFVVWQRMAYFGETIAQASLIGIAIGLFLKTDPMAPALGVSVLVGLLLIALQRQKLLPLDSLLGLMAHAALAAGVIATSLARGGSVDLMGYLFGDIFAVTVEDLLWIAAGGAVVLGVLMWLWRPLLALSVHEELAVAEGIDGGLVRAVFVLLLALVVALAMKIVGILLIISFLIMPAAAARPFAATPERMAVLAALVGGSGVAGGIGLSLAFDTPGGPSIVLVLAAQAGLSLASVSIVRE